MTADVLENNSDSVTEDDLKRAFRSIVLYMAEQDMDSIDTQVRIPKGDGGKFFVDLEIAITNGGEFYDE